MQKCDTKSSKYRVAGNTMFSRAKLREALRLYTEAAVWASPASPDLAMAFANRSAAHFDGGHFGASLAGNMIDSDGDTNRILDHDRSNTTNILSLSHLVNFTHRY